MPPSRPAELTAADVSLLREEEGATHVHVGGVAVFAGSPPPIDEIRAHVLARLSRVPRYRARLVEPPFGVGRPRWAPDPSFRVEYHVRHTALPSPGDEAELRVAAGRIFSQRLDRTKPLWELWVVEGLLQDHFAVVTKSHGALVDGVVAMDLMTALLDPHERRDGPAAGRRAGWAAPPLPSRAQLVAAAAGDAGRLAAGAPRRVLGALVDPRTLPRAARGGAALAGALLGPRLKPAPPSPLNVPIGPHRRLAHATVPVADLKRIKDTFGGTVNDVVLAVAAGAIRQWMQDRGLHTTGLELRAAVPLAIEAAGREARPMALAYAPLPVGEPDPLARHERIRRSMAQKLAGRHPLSAATMTAQDDAFAPPSVLAQASRLRFDARRFNVLVANVPGPQHGMYLLGRRLETAVPVPFLAGDRALAIAVTSYDGLAEFGLLGDLDKLPDLETVAAGITAAVDELLALARQGRTARRVPRAAR